MCIYFFQFYFLSKIFHPAFQSLQFQSSLLDMREQLTSDWSLVHLDVAEKVFQCLDNDSFLACSEVCQSWNSMVSDLVRRRRQLMESVKVMVSSDRSVMTSAMGPCLLNACQKGHCKSVEILLANGARKFMEFEDRRKMTALQLAAENGHKDTVNLLIAHGADVNRASERKPSHKFTPLQYASANGHLNVVEVLLAHGAKVNRAFVKKKRTVTALHLANQNGHRELAKTLRAKGAVCQWAKCQTCES